MAKPFRTINQQLEILEERGVIVSHPEKAAQYILEHSYYNVVNVSSKFFKQANSEQYIKGTSFDEIRAVHIYDSELKSIIFKNILTAEKHLKSILAYRFGEKYCDKKYAYLRTETYEGADLLNISKTISSLSNIIQNKIKDRNSNSIKHYYNNHKEVPIWVLINELTLGQTYYLFKILDDSLKNQIAKDLNKFLIDNVEEQTILEPNTLEKFLFNLKDIRNSVAHDNIIFNFKAANNLQYMEALHAPFSITPSDSKQDVFNNLLYLQLLLTSNQYSLMLNTINKRNKTLSNKLNTIDINKIYSSLGFPENFQLLNTRNQNK